MPLGSSTESVWLISGQPSSSEYASELRFGGVNADGGATFRIDMIIAPVRAGQTTPWYASGPA
jgi:hypothetical protein